MKAELAAPALRQRLSRWLALQTLMGLGLVCAAVYVVTASTLSQRQNETLDQKAAMVQHLLRESREQLDEASLQHQLSDFLAGHEELTLTLQAPGGQTLFASSPPRLLSGTVKQRQFDVLAPSMPSTPLRAVLSLGTQADEALLRQLALTLAAAAIIGAAAVSLGCYYLVSLGLAPLRQLVDQTRQLSASQLDKRLDGSAQPRELQALIEQFNALLARLDQAYHQMEGFNADVAHELNSPLATLISSCELALRKTRNADELREVLASNLDDLQRIAGIVKDMLFLSQADRGASARRTPVDSLAALAGDVVEFHEPAMQEASLIAEVIGDASGSFDAGLLRRALSNLLGNATRYATPGSAVRIEIEPSGADQAIKITVINQGAGIAAAHLPRLFDRFYRADPARTQADLNHGLGLSIVAAIARMHGGEPFADSKNGMTRIGISLPAK